MYTSFFGFKENPFKLTPDPRYLFLSRFHREALDHLLYGVNERKGFIVITGGIGTGKTTLCRAFLSHLNSSTKSALIFNSFISDIELLKTINQEFGIEMDPPPASKKDYIDALNHFLLSTFSNGGNAILLIDEAQNLSYTVLEQIRMLSNLETENEKLIQIVLVGQHELKELLAAPTLKQLDERITVRYDLRPLDRKDIQGYVEHRLGIAGGRENLRFTSGSFAKIYAYSQGNPRRINAICDRTLLIAYAKNKSTISKGTVTEAVHDLRGKVNVYPSLAGLSSTRFRSVTVLLLLLIFVAAFAGWGLRKNILGLFFNENKIVAVNTKHVQSNHLKPKRKSSSVFLDEQNSFARLFMLFNKKRGESGSDSRDLHFDLVTLDVEPENYVMFRRPFRIHLPNSSPSLPHHRYILISKITPDGVVAIDSEDKEQAITRDFILKNWDKSISWLYAHKDKNIRLKMGMNSPDVLKVQKILNMIGYLVEPSGNYDKQTHSNILRFQRNFGLKADGIVGPRTMALLYLMSD
ncbi:MAG: AAA family ATPase [Deltaproteobacteria bacterium]|nr:AAA family ATPase [Deltaproteobacteria bacterium]